MDIYKNRKATNYGRFTRHYRHHGSPTFFCGIRFTLSGFDDVTDDPAKEGEVVCKACERVRVRQQKAQEIKRKAEKFNVSVKIKSLDLDLEAD